LNEGFFLQQHNDMENDKRKVYNDSITTLDERYTSLTPLTSYIVRLYIRDEVRTKSGLFIPDARVKSTSHSGMAEYNARDPFGFTGKAVIVGVPAFEQELKAGDVVQIVKPQMIADKEEVLGYVEAYAHPDYQLPMIPADPSDPDFGYALVPRTYIKVLISKAGVKVPDYLYVKNSTDEVE